MTLPTLTILLAVVLVSATLAQARRRRARSVRGLAIGDRVRVVAPGLWADGATGRIATPPPAVASLAGDWLGHVRLVSTTAGKCPYYWVVLDEPRADADGDGPYREAELAESWLRLSE